MQRMKTIHLIIIALGAVAVFLVYRKQTANAIKQDEFDVTPRRTLANTAIFSEDKAYGSNATGVKSNATTSNLITEDGLRSVFNGRLGAQGLDIFEDENFTINIEKKYKPIGNAQVYNPTTSKPVNKNFVGRTQETFKIVTTKKATGEKKIRYGSEALAKRLQQNYASNV